MMMTSSQGAFCTYYRNSNRVSCGSVTCSTASPDDPADKLPSGYYYIGNFYTHPRLRVPWFNLYRERSSSKGTFWDYSTLIPELGCRGGFGLHSGSVSEGCVTVTDSSCFTRLKDEINRSFPVVYFNVYECISCSRGWWWSQPSCSRTQTIRRPCTADLQSI